MDNTQARPFVVRRAAAADAAALTRLREVMLSEMGMLAAGAGPLCRGYAPACLNALLAWFRDETQARVINLNTTGDGTALYRSLGFSEPRYPVLQLRLARPGARP